MPCQHPVPSSVTFVGYDYYGRPDSYNLNSARHSLHGWSAPQPLSFDSKSWSTSYIPSPPSSIKAGSTGSCVEQAPLKSAYYLDRGNGKVTRLVPADQLPPMNEIPQMENKSQGMDVLPPLPGNPRAAMGDMHQGITFKENTNLAVQKVRRDTPNLKERIVRPQNTIQEKCKLTGKAQKHQKPGKQDKKYCDKWVHEGVCAFAQQGCRYKHEMPYDKATQNLLGLYHGLPVWWKRRQAELHRQQEFKNAAKRRTLSNPYQAGAMTPLEAPPADGTQACSVPIASTPWNSSSWEEAKSVKDLAKQSDFTVSTGTSRCPYGAIRPPSSCRK
ncbi:unnamed protein product [Clonostachys rosea]|uniref:C3H1-type domain-containing protein n=1 Tax=Bionectria ochroleuca TaxID=29856 RepID=A0ABY6TW01_BIOOC|nr:unnamed protein product [Clonostachys rosea]